LGIGKLRPHLLAEEGEERCGVDEYGLGEVGWFGPSDLICTPVFSFMCSCVCIATNNFKSAYLETVIKSAAKAQESLWVIREGLHD